MIVEFIGCSGAGKTTLARELEARIDPPRQVVRAVDLVMDRPGLRWISDPMAINLVADVVSFPSFLRARERAFVRFAFDRLRRYAPSTFAKYNYMLNIVRRVGVQHMSRRAALEKTILVDEGVVLSAYQLFVYSDAPFNQADLDRFARLAPMPDQIVYVKAPLELLVERAMRRPDQRRELVGRSRRDVEERLARAVDLFDGLAATPPIRERLLVVEIGDDSVASQEEAVRRVSSFLSEGEKLSGRVRLIAFVGSEASGKSTVLNEVEAWLGEDREVRRIHAGKPPSTSLTFVPHILLPAFRALFPEQRLLRVEARIEKDPPTESTYGLLFALRAVMLAYERRALITAALRRSPRGAIVLSDRYPSSTGSNPDGPQLSRLSRPRGRFSARHLLAAIEDRLYGSIPPPDLVFHLSAPLEVTLARNAAREKREPEEYVRFRHTLSADLRFDGVVHRIDTDKDLDTVIIEVEQAISEAMGGADTEVL
jgi:thymidylate kinase